jgi:hypothetical protein
MPRARSPPVGTALLALSSEEIRIMIGAQDRASAQLRQVAGELNKLTTTAHATGPSFTAMSAAMATGTLAANALQAGVTRLTSIFSSVMCSTASFGQSMANLRAYLPDQDFQRFGASFRRSPCVWTGRTHSSRVGAPAW